MIKDIETTCPICEEDITLKGRDIKMAHQHKGKTGGKALIGCPMCARVMVLPLPDELKDDAALEAYIGNIEDVTCVPFLDDTVARMPAGTIKEMGLTKYEQPGGGGTALVKREYMDKYGVDPEIGLKLMGRPKIEPFPIGG